MEKVFEFYATSEDGVIRIPDELAKSKPRKYKVVAMPHLNDDEEQKAQRETVREFIKGLEEIDKMEPCEETLELDRMWDEGEFRIDIQPRFFEENLS